MNVFKISQKTPVNGMDILYCIFYCRAADERMFVASYNVVESVRTRHPSSYDDFDAKIIDIYLIFV